MSKLQQNNPVNMPDDVVLSVRGVSKKFCRNLKRSLWYGIQDLSKNLLGFSSNPETEDRRPKTEDRGDGGGVVDPNSLQSSVYSGARRSHEGRSLGLQSNSAGLQSAVSSLPSDPRSLPSSSDPQGLQSSVSSLQSNSAGLQSSVSSLQSDLRPAEFWALRDISFDLRRGEVLGLIGRNGCGKTTLLRLIAGIFPPDTGEIAVRGRVGR